MSFALLMTCIVTPIYIAFYGDNDAAISWEIMNMTIDVIFGLDIFAVFMTAYYDEDFKLVDDRKVIALSYIRGMFICDVIAILPFDLIIRSNSNSNNINGIIRITKIGRLYKLIKLTRLLKMIKILK